MKQVPVVVPSWLTTMVAAQVMLILLRGNAVAGLIGKHQNDLIKERMDWSKHTKGCVTFC
jgi:hypothetical protein